MGWPEQSGLGGERRLVARLAAAPLQGIHQRRLLAADVGSGAAPQLDVEAHAVAQDVVAEEAAVAAALEGVLDPRQGQRVFATQVKETFFAAGGEARDRHRLDQREGIVLHQDAVLEGAGLGLVGVADEVARQRGRARPLPLDARGKGGAAAPHELGVDHLPHHRRRAHLEGAAQGEEAARGPVAVQARGIDPADAGQQLQARLPGLRHRDGEVRLGDGDAHGGREHVTARGRGQRLVARRIAGRHHQRRGRPLAEAEAGAAVPGGVAVPALPRGAERGFHLPAERLGAPRLAGDVVADVHGHRRMGTGLEQSVEIRHAEGLGRRDLQLTAGVVERPRAHPPLAVLDGVQHRDQILPAVAVQGEPGEAAVDGVQLFRIRLVGGEVQVHSGWVSWD